MLKYAEDNKCDVKMYVEYVGNTTFIGQIRENNEGNNFFLWWWSPDHDYTCDYLNDESIWDIHFYNSEEKMMNGFDDDFIIVVN